MKENIETKEKLEGNFVSVVFVRHGETTYQEHVTPDEEKIIIKKNGTTPTDLTEKGVKTMGNTAKQIINTLIDKERDVIVFWGSPAWRAQGSKDIIKKTFEESKVQILKDKEIDYLKYATHHDNDSMVKFWEDVRMLGKSTDLIYAYDEELQKKTDKLEVASETRKRAESFINYIHLVMKKVSKGDIKLEKNKRLVFLSVSHFEILNPIVQDIFGVDLAYGDRDLIKKGEVVALDFVYDEKTDQIKINAQFRGIKKENIVFDRTSRKFILEKK
ncbi:MAG: histidine phosphatase family protein [Candidatus Pacebacteria bacterium]|nr:histidine phosphatase family protein [Candidatus Paceibacterota bacterium]